MNSQHWEDDVAGKAARIKVPSCTKELANIRGVRFDTRVLHLIVSGCIMTTALSLRR